MRPAEAAHPSSLALPVPRANANADANVGLDLEFSLFSYPSLALRLQSLGLLGMTFCTLCP